MQIRYTLFYFVLFLNFSVAYTGDLKQNSRKKVSSLEVLQQQAQLPAPHEKKWPILLTIVGTLPAQAGAYLLHNPQTTESLLGGLGLLSFGWWLSTIGFINVQ